MPLSDLTIGYRVIAILVFFTFSFINVKDPRGRRDRDAWLVVMMLAVAWPMLLPWSVYWHWRNRHRQM